MKSEITDLGDIRTIRLNGKITIGSGDIKLRELVNQAIEDGFSKIILDLGKVPSIDSSGIGELVATYHRVARNDGQLKLVRLSKKINDILQVTQLLTVFDLSETEQEAIDSFK